MTRRSFTLAIALCAFLTLPVFTSAQMMSGISGDWSVQGTGAHFHQGVIHLSQQGNVVVGHITEGANTLQLNGTFTNEKLSGTWRGPSGETGWLTLNFAASGQGFSGEWGYHGRKPEGNIVGKKKT